MTPKLNYDNQTVNSNRDSNSNTMTVINNRNNNNNRLIEIKNIFKIFDRENVGHFNKNQLKQIMHSFGFHISTNELNYLLTDIKLDECGNIGFNEFHQLFNKIENSCDENCGTTGATGVNENRNGISRGRGDHHCHDENSKTDDLKQIFSIFDKQQNGFISFNEIKYVVNMFGLDLSDDEIKEMIAEADQDNDELINLYDLMVLLHNDDYDEDHDTDNDDEDDEDDENEASDNSHQCPNQIDDDDADDAEEYNTSL